MTRTTVIEVRSAGRSEGLRGCAIDAPVAGEERATWSLDVRGWAIGDSGRAIAAEGVHDGQQLWRVPIDVRRPQAVAGQPGATDDRVGFHALPGTLQLPSEFELEVRAVLEDGGHAALGVVHGRRAELRTPFEPRRNPVLVTTLGRTGSMLLMRLLASHPELLVYRPHRFEQRIASYWADLLLTLAEPVSHIRQIAPPSDVDDPQWWLGARAPVPWGLRDTPVEEWLAGEAVEALAVTCQERVEALYDRVVATTDTADASLFAEKCGLRAAGLLSELYPGGRELFLVRDFRDMLSSILAFNAKRGVEGFGRAGAASDAEFVRSLETWAGAFARAWERRSARAHLVRYEDLVLDPERTLSVLLGYLGVATGADVVAVMIDTLREELPELREHGTSDGPRESVGRWRRDLDPELALACEQSLGPALAAFGYESA
jgi:Sulfotransferase family